MAWRERLSEAREVVEERLGYTAIPKDRLELYEARSREAGALRRELDSLAWTALNYSAGSPQELRPEERRKIIQKARVVWMKDPQAGAAIDLMNEFVFGRGMPKPKANDEKVQEVLDDWWDDVDNQEVLTSYTAQLAFGTDLSIQSNVFVLVFDEGEDGKVKLAILDHDDVEAVVRDPDAKHRVMYYVARHFRQEWDFENDMPDTKLKSGGFPDARAGAKGEGEIRYYAHWRNVEEAVKDAEEGLRDAPNLAPEAKMGEGKVFHVAINRTSAMAFGHPTMDRLLRWYNAYNTFIDARLDIIQAKAAFVMRRKVKGTPSQLNKLANQALSRRGALGMAGRIDPLTGEEMTQGPHPASILGETDTVTHEDVSLDTGAASAEGDGRMIKAQTSAGTRFPPTYYGDLSAGSLATSTSLELPVVKAVETRQEIVEQVVRFGADRAIERAVEVGRLDEQLGDDERSDQIGEAVLRRLRASGQHVPRVEESALDYLSRMQMLMEAHEDAVQDEIDTKRDLGYEFQLPSPLRRMMPDLISGVASIAQVFDPNNTNMELSRVLLGVALGEGLELADPQGAVERIFPPGYVDPMAAAMQQPQGPQDGMGEFSPQGAFGEFSPGASGRNVPGADGQQHSQANPYGAPMQAGSRGWASGLTQARVHRRDGRPLHWSRVLEEATHVRDLPPEMKERFAVRRRQTAAELDMALDDALTNGIPE